ncbi:MAG: hypothetical protein RIG61_01505 [Deltaproteobacteria bacterium]
MSKKFKNKNPYLKQRNRQIKSLVCHSDILGYKEFAQRSTNANLQKLNNTLSKAYEKMLGHRGPERFWPEEDYARFEMKTFTDNVVVGYPIQRPEWDHGEPELGDLIWLISNLQLFLALDGFFIRGGVAYGKCYIDEHVVFGEAFVDAVQLDKSNGAPRIVFSNSARKSIEKHFEAHGGRIESTPHYHDLLKDADGEYFINYLNLSLIAYPYDQVFFDFIIQHKNQIEHGLLSYRGITNVYAKYEWAARYHNFFCEDFAQRYSHTAESQEMLSHVIKLEDFIPAPCRLA